MVGGLTARASLLHKDSPMNNPSTGTQSPLSLSDRVRSLKLNNARLQQRRQGSAWLPWTLCLLLLGVSGFLGYLVATDQPLPFLPARTETTPKGANEASTRTAGLANPLVPIGGKVALTAGGYVIPVMTVQVSPKVGGQVLKLFMEEGQRVNQGDPLATLDPTEYEFEYNRTKAMAEQARARYDELLTGNREEEKKRSQAAYDEAVHLRDQLRDEFERYRKSGKAVSQDDVVKIESRLRQAEKRVEQLYQENKMMLDGARKERIAAAKAEWELCCAQRDKAKYYLDNTQVLAPIAGTILIKRAEVGNTVRPESFGQGLSANLCDMADLTQLEVDVDVSERDLNRVFKGQLCEVRTEAFPEKLYKGFVSRMMPTANKSKASVSVRVKIEVPADEVLLRPDMRARVTFLAPEKPPGEKKAGSPGDWKEPPTSRPAPQPDDSQQPTGAPAAALQ
jgi:multidrug efflux pump subunit AcrA (membrane-fusion protein)